MSKKTSKRHEGFNDTDKEAEKADKNQTNTGTHTSEATRVGSLTDESHTTLNKKLIPVLHISTGPEKGRIVPILDYPEVIIGRSKKNLIALDDPSCSRKHARIYVDIKNQKVIFEDLKSLNGCLINGIKKEHHILNDGDRIKLGDQSIVRFSLVLDNDFKTQLDIYNKSIKDPLTGAFNRRKFNEIFNREYSLWKRNTEERHVSILMLDIDHFKSVNDTHGHVVGDKVLVNLTQKVHELIRSEDIFARLGGEEFALITNVSEAGIIFLAERIRKHLAESTIRYGEAQEFQYTVSIGTYTFSEEAKELNSKDIVDLADKALYHAKNTGRNQCVSYNELSRSGKT